MWEFWEVIHFSSLQRQRRHCRGVERVHRCVCVRARGGEVCVWGERQRSGRMWVTTAAAAADCEPANFTSAVLICFFPFVLIFKIFSLFPSAAVFWGFYFIFTAVVVCFSLCGGGVSNEGIALAALRLSLFSERGSRRGRHCTGDRTACLPLLLPLGWWVTMMWCDLCPATPPPPCSFPNASPLHPLPLSFSLYTPLPPLFFLLLLHQHHQPPHPCWWKQICSTAGCGTAEALQGVLGGPEGQAAPSHWRGDPSCKYKGPQCPASIHSCLQPNKKWNAPHFLQPFLFPFPPLMPNPFSLMCAPVLLDFLFI